MLNAERKIKVSPPRIKYKEAIKEGFSWIIKIFFHV